MLADIASYKLGKLSASSVSGLSGSKSSSAVLRDISLQASAVILEKGLFGPSTKAVLTPITQTSVSTAPTTSQTDLILLGTATGSPGAGYALIRRVSSNEERVFKTGEKVFDLGVLKTVQKETVEVSSDSQNITLKTPVTSSEAGKVSSANQPNPNPQVVSPASGVVQSTPGGSGIIDQRALNAALDNIGQAMTDARLLPSLKNGKVEGFKVSEVKPQGVFAAVGLKNGDMLARINDFPVDSPEKAIQSFMTLKGQNRIKLDLIRDGAPTSLTYDIR